MVARKKAATNRGDRLKNHVLHTLEVVGIPKVKGDRFTARVQASPPSARWTGDPDKPPEGFARLKTSIDFDAKGAIEAFKRGESLPDGVEIRQGKHLVIR